MMSKKHAGNRKKGERWSIVKGLEALKSIQAKCVFVVFVGAALLIGMFCAAITPERYNLKVGAIAYKTITASKDVVDEITTARRREEAARQVEPSYHPKEGVTDLVMTDLKSIFNELRTVQQYGQTLLADRDDENTRTAGRSFEQAELDYAKEMLTTITFTDYQLTALLQTTSEKLDQAYNDVSAAVKNTLNTTIREGQVNESISNILQIVGYKTDMDLLQNVISPVLRECIRPNMVIEQEATAQAQEKARAEVEPVLYNQGQNIVVAGERVSANQLEMLRSLGLLDDNTVDMPMYAGAGILILTVVILSLFLLKLLNVPLMQDLRRITVYMLVLDVTLGLSILFMQLNTYLSPVSLGALLLTGLLGPQVGFIGNFALAILISALSAGGSSAFNAVMVHLLLTSFISGGIAVMALRSKPQRARMLLCGIYVALANLLVMLSIGLMTNNDLQSVLNNALWSMGGGITGAILCVGLQPAFEYFFNLSTPSKLLELSNPNQPLLRRLLLEAPGTYHHSIIVANLSEAAAEAIGANPLLARAGSYFHDVGKLKRPLYFKENQMGENPHDSTDPYVSAAIVTAHTRDGLMMAQKYRLPEEIKKIIMEHHGDTPVMYFYHKALQLANGSTVDINDFRYDGIRPTIRESAIVMLADTIEAAVRAMPDPTPQRIEAFIEQLIRGKLEDGQLSDAPLTLRDIDKIGAAFTTVLNGVFHERIEYPTVEPRGKIASLAAPEKPEQIAVVPEQQEHAKSNGDMNPEEKPLQEPSASGDNATSDSEPEAAIEEERPMDEDKAEEKKALGL